MRLNRRPLLKLLLLLSTVCLTLAQAEIRPVDPIFLENDCQPEVGVHPAAETVETEVVSFSSQTAPGQVLVACPKGFQAVERSFTSTGGTCTFSPAPRRAGSIVPPATKSSQLTFSCRKTEAFECDGGPCSGIARVNCLPIPTVASTRIATELCRTPGLYGQVSALTTAMMAGALQSASTETLAELQGGKALPTAVPAESTGPQEAPAATPEPAPQSQDFPGRKPPNTADPAK